MATLTSLILVAVVMYGGISVAEVSEAERGSCAGGFSNGADIVESMYWYQCQNGKRVNKGCIDGDNRQVPLGGTFIRNGFFLECIQSGEHISTKHRGCVVGNSPKEVGTQWEDGTAYFQCVPDGGTVRIQTAGCISDGSKVKLDDRVAKGGVLYACRKTNSGSTELRRAGCVYKGQKYNIGQQFNSAKFLYVCTDRGAEVIGCMNKGTALKDGDHYNNYADNVAYKCSVNGRSTAFKPFACIGPENVPLVDRRPGCSFTEGDIEYTCKEVGDKLAKVQTACVYHGAEGTFKVLPGCIQPAVTVAVGCSGTDKLSIVKFGMDQIDSSGLRRC